MARQPRFVLPGHPQYVIQRGNNRSVIFGTEEDYGFYLDKLREGFKKHGCDVHAYVLMTNHTHLLLTPHSENGIGKLMQFIGRYYVQYFNYQYRRTGTLWEGRYKATLLDSEQYLLTCYRYIELNPVRAAMVDHPREYPWSSYRFNAFGEPDGVIIPHELYQQLGKDGPERQTSYRALFQRDIDDRTLGDIRQATNNAWVLGNDRFRQSIEELTQRQAAPKPKGGDKRTKEYRESHKTVRV